jgi:hypothetical protein
MAMLRTAILVLVAALCAACDKSPLGPSAPEATFLSLVSGPSDPVGQAFSWQYTLENATFQASFDRRYNHVHMAAIELDGGRTWRLDVTAPAGEALTPGRAYHDVMLYSAGTQQPQLGMDFTRFTAFRLCSRVRGQFVLHELVIGPGDTLDRFHASFVQFCNDAPTSLTGEVRIVANPWR